MQTSANKPDAAGQPANPAPDDDFHFLQAQSKVAQANELLQQAASLTATKAQGYRFRQSIKLSAAHPHHGSQHTIWVQGVDRILPASDALAGRITVSIDLNQVTVRLSPTRAEAQAIAHALLAAGAMT